MSVKNHQIGSTTSARQSGVIPSVVTVGNNCSPTVGCRCCECRGVKCLVNHPGHWCGRLKGTDGNLYEVPVFPPKKASSKACLDPNHGKGPFCPCMFGSDGWI